MAAAKHKGGLGKGVEAFFSSPEATKTKKTTPKAEDAGEQIVKLPGFGELRMIRLSKIEPDRKQPRKKFDPDALQELANSIKEHGLLEPIDVQKNGDRYTLVNGERRWRAAKLAGLKEVPAIVADYDEKRKALVGLIDNIQREDLNPIEEANAYNRLIEEFDLKQDEVAKQVSKSRAAITNSLRLLKLTPEVQQMVIDATLSMGQARALIPVDDPIQQKKLADEIVAKQLNVREVEKLVKNLGKTQKHKKKNIDASMDAIYKDFEKKANDSLGMKVDIKARNGKAGKIEITFATPDDFEKIMDRLLPQK